MSSQTEKIVQDMGTSMPCYLYENLHQNFNRHILGLISSTLLKHAEILVHY